MQPATHLENLLQYTTLAASTIRDLSDSMKIPFLNMTATLSVSILQNIDGMGKIKQFFKQYDNAAQLNSCQTELQNALKIFQVHSGALAATGVVQVQRNAKEQHQELLKLLADHPNLSYSDGSSLVTGTLSHLVDSIASYVGLENSPKLPRKIVQHFSLSPPSLLVLDNFETPRETLASHFEVEEFLSLLSDVPHLALMITMRGAERPGKAKWTRPFLGPLEPLSDSAALQTFIDIADDSHKESSVKELLELTGNLPLAVSLMVNIASHEGCEEILSCWKRESTRLLSDGAQELLGLLSMLPDGLSDADLVQSQLPIPNILSCKATLIQISLAYVDNNLQLKSLIPIREFMRNAGQGGSQLLSNIHTKIGLWESHPIYGHYLIEMVRSSRYVQDSVAENYIKKGNNYFQGADTEDQAKWYHTLGDHYQYSINDLLTSLHYRQLALSHIKNPTNMVYVSCLARLSFLLSAMGDHLEGRIYAQKAQECAKLCGDTKGQAMAISNEAFCCYNLGDFQSAAALFKRAKDLEPRDFSDKFQQWETDMHILKTEYAEAQKMTLAFMENRAGSPGRLDVFTVVAEINLALIGVCLGTESESVNHHLNVARHQCTTLIAFPSALNYCDMVSADLYLQDGNTVWAKQILEKSLVSFIDSRDDQGVTFCLERLANLSHLMHDPHTTLQWAGVLLASALRSKNKLATMKALCSIGDICFAEADEQTALSLYEVALDGFTFMGVHQWKTNCMMHIAAVFEHHGDTLKCLELWKAARPLFEQSSQAKDVAMVDGKVEAAMQTMAAKNKANLAQLLSLHVPTSQELGEMHLLEVM
ncbi:hypothetical protein B0H10DRAFT_1942216 [Mycena sp. CBHHK59/15]|nr:hypothetical protein B0H10DRAFT_1942216 [Mycena sp. CBHHK59/15]